MSVAEICVDDVEELSCSVDPWQTQIYRLAGSYFSGDTPIAELAGVFMSGEIWSRKLEIAFKEATGLSPKIYMQRVRLNTLHSELTWASPNSSSVTRAAQDLGFTELGRTAGYYREIFGECPSQTLKSNPELSKLRFSDLLDSAVH